MPMTNPLDVLFKEMKRDQWLEAAKPPRPRQPTVSTYANPDNWVPKRAVRLVHAETGPLGVYREYYHKASPSARRLLPAPNGTISDLDEIVFGDWWLHSRNSGPSAPLEDSPNEITAIRARFYELLEEFSNEDD